MASGVFNSGKGASLDWSTVVHMLVDQTYNFDPDHNTVSDVVSSEIAGTGASRKTSANPTETQDDTGNKVVFDADDPVWAGANFTNSVRGCITYDPNTNDSDHRLVCYNEFPSGPVQGVNTSTEVFTITGDLTADIEAGDKIVISGSTGNDGVYTVTAVAANGGNTDITVSEDVTNATADGTLTLVVETNGANFTFQFPSGGLFESV